MQIDYKRKGNIDNIENMKQTQALHFTWKNKFSNSKSNVCNLI